MNRKLAACCLVTVIALAACSQDPGKGVAPKVDNVAVVDGRALTRNTFNHYVKGVTGKPAEEATATQLDELLQNLIRAEVVAGDAERSGLAKQDETRAVMDMGRLTVMQQAAQQNYLKDRKPSEEELRAEYDLQVAGRSKLEYRASHILVPTEEAAKQVQARLKAGTAFAQVAREASVDSNSRERGGDLDWFSPERMTPEIAAVVTTLKNGETANSAIKTQFGWHIVRLTDTRDAVPPPFESVRDQVVQFVEGKKFKAYVDELVKKAKITKTP